MDLGVFMNLKCLFLCWIIKRFHLKLFHHLKYWHNLTDKMVIGSHLTSWSYIREHFSHHASTRKIPDPTTVLVSEFSKTLTALYPLAQVQSAIVSRVACLLSCPNLQAILPTVGFMFCNPMGSPISCLIYVTSL